MSFLIQASYFVAAVLFILGLKRMASPRTAVSGIKWAGIGMVLAVLATFFYPNLHNVGLIVTAIVIGGAAAWISGKKVEMTDMPQMVALYNGMGGGAAGAISAVELYSGAATSHGSGLAALAVIGGVIGAVSLSGSVIAYAKLQGLMKKAWSVPMHQGVNALMVIFLFGIGLALATSTGPGPFWITVFFLIALTLGVFMTTPIGGADMPVVISLYNALTGLAVAFEGFVLGNAAMIIAGTVVGAAGSLLTLLMAKAMNRSLANVLFSGFGASDGDAGDGPQGTMTSVEASDAAISMSYAAKVIIVPGYGMAVAQAQHKLWEYVQMLTKADVEVKFAIHPVAGRMPGHMNVLLAEAGVPYDMIFDLDEINEEFAQADAALVIGANDVVNPAARTNESSPIYGMPILNVDQAREVFVIKRGKGTGFSGVENELFFGDNTNMVFGDAKEVCNQMITGLKEL
ncbi:NAD(P)(+) transhydrogenase (Re/Si-specific) subunit beta [uncultured Abyssibacter sp.]|uniref:NAD(P)(+) transhydrogenase (Re/Si-specific) subunit beta n=1 Tax=uncultured Abyssibacter sp. TaxID=2320202 RepID=UPI0032B1EDD7